jgi:hypothetical protein
MVAVAVAEQVPHHLRLELAELAGAVTAQRLEADHQELLILVAVAVERRTQVQAAMAAQVLLLLVIQVLKKHQVEIQLHHLVVTQSTHLLHRAYLIQHLLMLLKQQVER